MRFQLNRHGFTLAEVMIAIVIFSLIVGTLIMMNIHSRDTYDRGQRAIEVQQNGRAVLDLITEDMRQAGSDPFNAFDATFKIASQDTIEFVGDFNSEDLNGNGVLDPVEAENARRYRNVDADDRPLYGDSDVNDPGEHIRYFIADMTEDSTFTLYREDMAVDSSGARIFPQPAPIVSGVKGFKLRYFGPADPSNPDSLIEYTENYPGMPITGWHLQNIRRVDLAFLITEGSAKFAVQQSIRPRSYGYFVANEVIRPDDQDVDPCLAYPEGDPNRPADCDNCTLCPYSPIVSIAYPAHDPGGVNRLHGIAEWAASASIPGPCNQCSIEKIELYMGASMFELNLHETDTGAPFEGTINTLPLDKDAPLNTPMVIQAKAYETGGKTSTSPIHTIYVDNWPNVDLVYPVDNQEIAGEDSIQITLKKELAGITKVELYLESKNGNGVDTLLTTIYAADFGGNITAQDCYLQIPFNTTQYVDDVYYLRAISYNKHSDPESGEYDVEYANHVAEEEIEVTIRNFECEQLRPTIEFVFTGGSPNLGCEDGQTAEFSSDEAITWHAYVTPHPNGSPIMNNGYFRIYQGAYPEGTNLPWSARLGNISDDPTLNGYWDSYSSSDVVMRNGEEQIHFRMNESNTSKPDVPMNFIGMAEGPYTFWFEVQDKTGCRWQQRCILNVTAGNTPPVVEIDSPSYGDEVNCNSTFIYDAWVWDDRGIDSVQFFIDYDNAGEWVHYDTQTTVYETGDYNFGGEIGVKSASRFLIFGDGIVDFYANPGEPGYLDPPVPPGTHYLLVRAWDTNGFFSDYEMSIYNWGCGDGDPCEGATWSELNVAEENIIVADNFTDRQESFWQYPRSSDWRDLSSSSRWDVKGVPATGPTNVACNDAFCNNRVYYYNGSMWNDERRAVKDEEKYQTDYNDDYIVIARLKGDPDKDYSGSIHQMGLIARLQNRDNYIAVVVRRQNKTSYTLDLLVEYQNEETYHTLETLNWMDPDGSFNGEQGNPYDPENPTPSTVSEYFNWWRMAIRVLDDNIYVWFPGDDSGTPPADRNSWDHHITWDDIASWRSGQAWAPDALLWGAAGIYAGEDGCADDFFVYRAPCVPATVEITSPESYPNHAPIIGGSEGTSTPINVNLSGTSYVSEVEFIFSIDEDGDGNPDTYTMAFDGTPNGVETLTYNWPPATCGGFVTIEVRAYNPEGCFAADTVQVLVEGTSAPQFQICDNPLFVDDFNQGYITSAWATNDDWQYYSKPECSNGGGWRVETDPYDNCNGYFHARSGCGGGGVGAAWVPSVVGDEYYIKARIQFPEESSYKGLIFGYEDENNFWRLVFESNYAQIRGRVNGSWTNANNQNESGDRYRQDFVPVNGEWYWVKYKVTRTEKNGIPVQRHQAKWWREGLGEPGSWILETYDDRILTGSPGIYAAASGSDPNRGYILVDDFVICPASYEDDGGAIPTEKDMWCTPYIYHDDFTSGSTPLGFTESNDSWWSTNPADSTYYSNRYSGSNDIYTFSTPLTSDGYEIRTMMRITNSPSSRSDLPKDGVGIIFRYNDYTNYDFNSLLFTKDKMFLMSEDTFSGTLGSSDWNVGLANMADMPDESLLNTWYFIKLRVQGERLYAKAWEEGVAEPGWMIVVGDTMNIDASIIGLKNGDRSKVQFKNFWVCPVPRDENCTDQISYTDLSPGSSYPMPYYTANMLTGSSIYIDDFNYRVTSMPASVRDGLWIKTANSDANVHWNTTLIEFTADRNITVIVAKPQDANTPSWLSNWNLLPDELGVSGDVYYLFANDYNMGELVELPGLKDNQSNNYVAIITCR